MYETLIQRNNTLNVIFLLDKLSKLKISLAQKSKWQKYIL